MSHLQRLALLLLLVFAMPLQQVVAVSLTENGQPAATIVIRASALAAEPYVPKNFSSGLPDAKVHLAALDLQEYIRKISGAQLPIVADDALLEGPMILVGASARTAALNHAIPAGMTRERRGDEGYVIIAEGDLLILAGNDDGPYHGTHYAVAELLNRLGVRWFMPTEFGEIVPQQPTIVIDPIHVQDAPDFPMRSWWSHMRPAMEAQEAIWKLRNKLQLAPAEVLAVPFDSSIRSFVADKEAVTTNPELFARHANGSVNPHLPNLTSPEAQRIAGEKAIAMIEKRLADTGVMPHSIGISPDDGLPVDYTPASLKRNQGFTGIVGREGVLSEISISEEWMDFTNAMAAHIAAKYPDVILTTNGYANRDIPPEGVELHPNIGILYAAIWADTLKPFTATNSWHGQVQGAMLKRWCELNNRVFIYNYNYNMLASLLTPLPTVSKLRVNLPLMKEWGVFGFFDETRQAYIEHGITTRYLRTKLYWHAGADVDATLDDFYAAWYGPAAAPAKAYWEALERRVQESPMLGHEDRILPYLYTRDLIAELRGHVAAAEALAQTERQRLHLRIDALGIDLIEAYMDMHDAEFAGDYAGAVAQADRLAELGVILHEINPFLLVVPGPNENAIISGTWSWSISQRRQLYQSMHEKTTGVTGDLIAMADRNVSFTLDEADLGKPLRWHEPDFDRSAWPLVDVTVPYYLHGHLSPEGVPYRGLMWYVFEVDLPATAADRPVNLYAPVVTAEAWVWVNGRYIGNRPYLEAYVRPAPLELEISKALRPGQRNVIAVRVSTGMNISQAPDGFQGRLFLYAPR